ncbi:MAG: hypothetical protein JXR70_17005 [Spirochaetales bacterium]|nr:hypothetical protein [Spirochaetales bacterium]
MVHVLIIFASPLGHERIRTDKENRIISQLEDSFRDKVRIERLHATEVEDIHKKIINGNFDIIQFSGHGCNDGIYLENSSSVNDDGIFIKADKLVHIIELANKQPLLVLFLTCFSSAALDALIEAAPFVISAVGDISDQCCITFIEGFYEQYFRDNSVQGAFNHALTYLKSKDLPAEGFQLARRSLIKMRDSFFIESNPLPDRNSILVNMDAVLDKLDKLGLSIEEICHMIRRKLMVHYWIFHNARDNAIIPIGRTLFGEFKWENSNDVIECTKIMKLRSDIPRINWEIWSKVLMTYNDLASMEYRTLSHPLSNPLVMKKCAKLFYYQIRKNIIPLREILSAKGFDEAVPHLEFAVTYAEQVNDFLENPDYYDQLIPSMEKSLTNLHEMVTVLQPQEVQ